MPLIQSLFGQSSYRSLIQVAPVRQGFQVLTSNQNVFTTNYLLNGRYTATASNAEIYQNGAKLGYQNSTNKDYDIIPYYNGSTTAFQITLTNNAYYGDYIDAVIFPQSTNDANLRNPPGYIYQNFYDLWSVSNNCLAWPNGGVSIGTNACVNGLDLQGTAAFGAGYAGLYTAPANSVIISGNLGIGTTNPQQSLQVQGNALVTGVLSASNLYILGTITTMNAYEYITSNVVINNFGSGPALQVTQQQTTSQPVASFIAGTTNAFFINNAGNVGIGTNVATKSLTVNGDISLTGGLFQNGVATWAVNNGAIVTSSNVGIGLTNPAYALDVNGTIRASSDVYSYSDKRIKANIIPITNALNTIDILQGVAYERIDLDNKRCVGLIAQDVYRVLPEVVNTQENGIMSISYGNMVSVLVEGIKELRLIVKSQDERIKYLESMINFKYYL